MNVESESLPVAREMRRLRKEYREKAKSFEYIGREYIKIYYPKDYTDIMRASREGLVHCQKIRGGRSRGERLYWCKHEIDFYLKVRNSLKPHLMKLSKEDPSKGGLKL